MKYSAIPAEEFAASAFDAQSVHFDASFGPDPQIQYKRARVRAQVERFLRGPGEILELNAGTGEDALYFASKGHRVHATDIAPGMQQKTQEKVRQAGMEHLVTTENCSFSRLNELHKKGPFDLIFSNFAGLNCSPHLGSVLQQFSTLLRPGGLVTLVILPRFCLWEFLLAAKGKFRVAFRRLWSAKGSPAKIDGRSFGCWYYNPSYVRRSLGNEFELLSLEGLCSLIPPAYILGFADRHPRVYRFLMRWEEAAKEKWPWKSVGDYYIISLKKKAVRPSR
jgi:ubiquinone/menaquinone biosynthesis C-methylase UbiE